MSTQQTQQTTPTLPPASDYSGGGTHSDYTPAGLGNRCDNFHRISDDQPLRACQRPAVYRITYVVGCNTHTVKRCPACKQDLETGYHILREEVLA